MVWSIFLVLPAPGAVAGGDQKPLGFAPKKTSSELVVYFHALGGETQEPYVQPTRGAAIVDGVKQIYPGAGFLSLDYDPSLVIAGDFKSIDETIKSYKKDFPAVSSIKLCGTSLGAYTALSYYACASAEIQNLIKGIVVIEAPDDLEVLAQSTRDLKLRNFLCKELLNSKKPKYLKERSLSQIYKNFKQQGRIYLLQAKTDIIVPAACTKDLETNLKARGFTVNLEKIDSGHGFPSLHFYEQGLRFTQEPEQKSKSLN